MSFCPFRSAPEKEVACICDCALYVNGVCAIRNIGSVDAKDALQTIHEDIDELSNQVYKVHNKLD